MKSTNTILLVGSILLFWFVAILLKPSYFTQSRTLRVSKNKKSNLTWYYSLDQALKDAPKNKSIIFLDFWAKWCEPCLEMDDVIANDPNFSALVKKYHIILVKIDLSSNQKNKNTKIAEEYDIHGLPTIILLKHNGQVLDKIEGFLSGAQFTKSMEIILK